MPRRSRLVGHLWRWHRRLGVLAALFVVVLSASGIILNHSSELGLDRSFVDWSWLSRTYGDNSSALPAYRLRERWLSRATDGHVYLDAQEVAPCSGRLVGVVALGGLFHAACSEQLLLITERGELVESVSSSTGLPVPLHALGLIDATVALRSGGNWFLVNMDSMDFSAPAPGGAVIQQIAVGKLPEAIRQQIPAPEQWLSWERVLLDLHSGRVLGRAGVFLVDAAGIVLVCLATSGLAMWWLHRRRRHRHSNRGNG